MTICSENPKFCAFVEMLPSDLVPILWGLGFALAIILYFKARYS